MPQPPRSKVFFASFLFTKKKFFLFLCAFILISLTALGLSLPHPVPGLFGIGYGAALQWFVAVACVQGVVYGLAVALLLHGAEISLGWVLGVAALLRLIVVVFPPFLSNDMYRYIWDGWVLAHGINPYLYIPADPHLAFLRDTVVYPNINRADYAHTIYPPAAEMMFFTLTRVAALLALPPVVAMKLGMLLLEAIGIAAMLEVLRRAGAQPRRIMIYAWNPLPVWEFAGSGHVDAIVVCFVSLALLAISYGKTGLSAAAMAMAVLAKFLPVVLLPALWRRWGGKFAAVFLLLLILGYLPFLSAGIGVFGFLGGYAAQEHIVSGNGVFLLALTGASGLAAKIYYTGLVLVFLAIALAMAWRPAADLPAIARRMSLLIGILMLGLSPHYPWYYAWALLAPCIAMSPASLYLASASFLLYLNPTHTKLFWPALVFCPFALAGAREVWLAVGPRNFAGAKT